MRSLESNRSKISEAANLLLRANTKYLQGDLVSCRELVEPALQFVGSIEREAELLTDIQFVEKQLHVLQQMLSIRENGFSHFEKIDLPLKIEAQVNLLRACISRGNMKASKESFERLLIALPPRLRVHPDILEIEKILQGKS